jgi:hypothetical protein
LPGGLIRSPYCYTVLAVLGKRIPQSKENLTWNIVVSDIPVSLSPP